MSVPSQPHRLPLLRRALTRLGRGLPPRPPYHADEPLPEPALGPFATRPLRGLDYVVFDTETTGLEPGNGDEIVQLAAVRVRGFRVLAEDSFDTLVDPGRPIPPRSTRFHGITDAMVRGAPTAAAVLPRFRAWCGDAVLVAHNAAFDLKFLALKQVESGVRFDDLPVLDTLLLSAALSRWRSSHTLDALALRFGVKVAGRHTALGDARATAEVLLHLLTLAERRGVGTLGQAIALSQRPRRFRRLQQAF
ncbi:MAG TPA: 3'-5' exonuclease [Alphaproteobacteria bacterium]|jgi:DNA polymerase-3 subunit epsilon|nr:3'-5' exonuclease [Alphaproteobacteria bacterium]